MTKAVEAGLRAAKECEDIQGWPISASRKALEGIVLAAINAALKVALEAVACSCFTVHDSDKLVEFDEEGAIYEPQPKQKRECARCKMLRALGGAEEEEQDD